MSVDRDFQASRRAMVLSQLRPEGVSDPAVLDAMGTIERERFLPASLAAMAYADRPLALDNGAPVFAPVDLGRLLNAAEPRPGERALVVGGGGDYSAAVLASIGLTVERSADLDSAAGHYDLVVVEGALGAIPNEAARLLSSDARLVTAVRDRGVSRLCIARRDGDGIALRTFADSHVPMVPNSAPEPAFTF